MARKKIELFQFIENRQDFFRTLKKNQDKLICAEVYSEYFGHCSALDRQFGIIKLDWSNGEILLLKVPSEEVDEMKRFRNISEPIFMFIVKGRVTRVFRGVHSMQFAAVAKMEWQRFQKAKEGFSDDRPTYAIDETTPGEEDYFESRLKVKRIEEESLEVRRRARNAARKRHRAERMAPHLQQLNFVLYWPHAKHAHPELYERWDLNNIMMVGREELELTLDKAKDILYDGDAPMNEASLHALMNGTALAICFRLLDDDKHFVSLTRRILYHDLPNYDDSKSPADQPPLKTAFDLYKSNSLTREQHLHKRKQQKIRKREELLEKRARRLSEMQRLARQAIEEAIKAKKAAREQQKLDHLKTGNLEALKQLREGPEDDEVSIVIPEELPDPLEKESSDEEDPNEYFPPPGLLIPGFYSPPNDVAKANGLAVLFPKLVEENVTPPPEFLPPHVLVLLHVSKSYKAIDALKKYKKHIIHMGIFKGESLNKMKHLAYTVKEFDALDLPIDTDIKLAIMVSTASDVPLLELMDLGPEHVSRDVTFGEEECANLFPLGYGDDIDQLEDFQEGA